MKSNLGSTNQLHQKKKLSPWFFQIIINGKQFDKRWQFRISKSTKQKKKPFRAFFQTIINKKQLQDKG